jgi:hypothetical protein
MTRKEELHNGGLLACGELKHREMPNLPWPFSAMLPTNGERSLSGLMPAGWGTPAAPLDPASQIVPRSDWQFSAF